ncbi:MAG: pyridoxamine 5'-phosphate oxidase family protein [Magnetospirillum sp.]|nr:pyridoxamine 5'-phosphate oxidase family protein [Magnetospirillum sp.]
MLTPDQERFVLAVMAGHNILTVATIRDDGYPQATTVAYANDRLSLYFACSPDSQKLDNIRRCNKVSATIDRDEKDWGRIQAVSLGGIAEVLSDPAEIRRATDLLVEKFPAMKAMAEAEGEAAEDMRFVRISPQVISAIDYTQGFGHTELLRVG